jgi:peptide/nickel transport system substrate-binding protein
MMRPSGSRGRLSLIVLAATALSLTGVATTNVSANERPSSTEDVPREETVIFDIDQASISSPFNLNPYLPVNNRNVGLHQSLMEPLFILNYETGEIEPWLGVEMEPNDDLTVWTLTLREGVKWQDGEDFNADDVVFTVNMLKENAPELGSDSVNMDQWVESVERIDDLTVQFNLTEPNPRFQLDHFSVRIWGSVMIAPEHIWEGRTR